MRKVEGKNGFKTLVFGRGDGMLVRWADSLQGWRAVAPERRRLAHAAAWYLDAEARSRRPLYGLQALAIFAERTLWEALTRCSPDGREVASARRAFLTVRRKLSQMRYRGRNGRIQNKDDVRYLRSSVAVCARLAAKAHALVKAAMDAAKEKEDNGQHRLDV